VPPIKKVTQNPQTKTVVRVHESRLRKKKGGGDGGGGGHDGGGALRWLLTYADMITLLLALFIILFSISIPNKVKYLALAAEMSGGFGGRSVFNTPVVGPEPGASRPKKLDQKTTSSTSSNPSNASAGAQAADKSTSSAASKKSAQSLKVLEKQVKALVAKFHAERQVVVRHQTRGLVISLLTDKTTFASGSAQLQSATLTLLNALVPFLTHLQNEIRIEGNTDNVPIATAEYPSNWELSAARAIGVTRFFIERGNIDPRRISAAGYGEYNPQVRNDTEEHRRLNRRVDIVIINTSVRP